MMNFRTQKLDHILSIGKSSSDYRGLGYQDGKDSNSQCVFVKASQLTDSPLTVKFSYLQKGKAIDRENVTFADSVKN